MLEIKAIETGYGKKQVLFGISLEVQKGEIVALIGPNGAGKSTVLKTVCGLISVWRGKLIFNGTLINGSTPARNFARGITFLPQDNRVFDELTVMENLKIWGFRLPRRKLQSRIEKMLEMFPILKNRTHQDVGKLSGGEQQMLALARVLIPKPKFLMLDEPSLALAPNLLSEVFNKIYQINQETGISILIVEQKIREVLNICHEVYSLKLGKVAFSGTPKELKEDQNKLKQLFL